MKRFFTLCALAATLTASAQTLETKDDTLVVTHPRRVVVVSNDSLQYVHIEGSATDAAYAYTKTLRVNGNASSTVSQRSSLDFSLPFGRKKTANYRNTITTSGLSLGLVTALDAPEGMDVTTGKSWEIGWRQLVAWNYTPRRGNSTFTIGVGLNWKNFRMTGRTRFEKTAAGNIILTDYPAGSEPKFSRIKVFSVTFPVLYSVGLSKRFGLSVGPIVNLNTYSSVKTRYVLNGEKQKEVQKDAHVNPVTVDLLAQLWFRGLGVYVKYSPFNVLQKDYGMQFRGLSFGITIF